MQERAFDGADGDCNWRVEADAALQLVDAQAGLLPLLGLDLFFKIELDGEIGVRGGDGVDQVDVSVGLFGSLAGVAKDALGVLAEADGAEPHAMPDGARGDLKGVLSGEHGAVGGVEDLGDGRTEKHAAEGAGVRGHDDDVESVAGGMGDLGGGVSGGEQARVPGEREFVVEEGAEAVACDLLMLGRDHEFGAEVKLHSVVAGGVENVDERDVGGEDLGGALDVSGHGDAGGGKVDGEKDVADDGHAAVPCLKRCRDGEG